MKTVIRLLVFIKPFIKTALLSLLLSTITVAANVGLMGTSAYLISAAALHPSIADLQVAIVGVRFFGIARAGLRYAERLVSHSLNFHILTRMRVWFYQKLEPLAPAKLIFTRTGDILASAVADIETLEDFYIRVVSPPLVAIFATLGMGLFIGSIDHLLAFVLAVGLLLGGFGLPVLMYFLTRTNSRDLIDQRAGLNTWLLDNLQGLDVIATYDNAGQRLTELTKYNREYGQSQVLLAAKAGIGSGLNILVSNGTIWVLLLVAVPLVTSLQIPGVLLAVIALASIASFEVVLPLPTAAQKLEGALTAAGRLFRLADQTPPVPEPINKPETLVDFQSLSLRRLTFRYAPELPAALTDISLELPAGKHIAIVGPSGAGKTTIGNILQRFWDVPDGQLYLNGHEIHEFALRDVRALLGVVSQSTDLFTLTVRQNLFLARPAAPEPDLWEALGQAQLDGWVRSLPHGLDTWLGDRSLQMSGGERQRLAIARVILQRAPLFLFDEPTANLDAVTEDAVLKTLLQITQKKTLIWITHRMKGLEDLDEILVMDQGQIVDRGRHTELMAKKGLYQRMWTIQNQLLDGSGTSF
ncbi:MAG TPA: thiol reductant ABC exporter subunit CydC [Longilinea sp.]|nr:thiol reductant ABC exporter subunit CydC [Longilinea sp.]